MADDLTMGATPVGFIGLGTIGAPMATRLVGRPGGVLVHDLRPEATAPLAEAGAAVAASNAEVGERCDVVSIMVLDDGQVRTVVDELLTTMRPGSVIAVHSTISEQTAIDTCELAAKSDVSLVDAPVTGGWVGAAEGRLAVMVGGERTAYERCTEAFSHWAELLLHVGPIGAGIRAKSARALLTFTGYVVAAEAQRLAEASGIDLSHLAAVVRQSDAITGGPTAIMVRNTTAPMSADDPMRPIFEHMVRLGSKDLALALELGQQLGVDLPFAQLAAERLASDMGVQ